MGVQAALIALGRAGIAALTGALHDAAGDYTVAMAVLTALLLAAAALVAWSPCGRAWSGFRRGRMREFWRVREA
jgi:hypothetical protein